ncbi:MAG: LysE family translocator [Microbacteriaceae bacterium]
MSGAQTTTTEGMRMELAVILAFVAVAAALVAVPGPDWAFIIASGSRDRVVVPAVSGVLIGYVVLTAMVALGVGAVAIAVPGFLTVLTLSGAGYLLYLGIRSFMPARTKRGVHAVERVERNSGHLFRGVGVSSLNPKAILIFLAILPQFAHVQAAWPYQLQLGVLGLIFTVMCFFIYMPLGFAARKVSSSKPRLGSLMPKVAAVSMIVLGSLLLVERVIELVS